MSDQNNNSRDFNYRRSISVESRGDLVIPAHHTQNIRSVFSPSKSFDIGQTQARRVEPVIDDVVQTVEIPTPIASNVPIPHKNVYMDDILKSQSAPQKPQIRVENTPKPQIKQEPAKVDEKPAPKPKSNTSRLHEKVKSRLISVVSKKPHHSKKQLKSPQTSSSSAAMNIPVHHGTPQQPSFTNSVLASAASTIPFSTTQAGTSVAIDNGGAGTIAHNGRDLTAGLAKLNSKVTLQFNIDHRKIAKFLKYLIIIAVIGVSGYLAWETWAANKPISYMLSQAVGAVSIDDTNPFNVDPTTVSSQAWSAHAAPADQPRYLYMPSINVKSRVDGVGINSRGNIDSPKNVNDAAWYDGSAKPGQDGQVFINGNKSYSASYEAAFDKLYQLKVGDVVTIENGNGDILEYKVVSNQTLDTDKVDMNKALNVPDNAKQGLTLMTYGGKYDYRDQSAEKRVIVYAVRE